MKNLIDIIELTPEEIREILDLSARIKKDPGAYRNALSGKTIALLFQKASTRTRISFETGVYQLGGYGLFLSSSDLQIGRGEPIRDTARVMSRYLDGIMARVFQHQILLDMVQYGTIPVINGLSDHSHPCQALADYFTIWEKKHKLEGLKVAYIGDGNNMAHSLLEGAAKLGIHFAAATPPGFEMSPAVIKAAQLAAARSGSEITLTDDPKLAASNADILYTDVWASMGQEAEAERRKKAFQGFQVDAALMRLASPECRFMHCLPAHRGEEVSEEVIESTQSIVFDQAENRLHVQKAIMVMLMGQEKKI